MPSGPSSARPGQSWLNRFLGYLSKQAVVTDQNTFVVIVIDESGLTGNIALTHSYDTAFFLEQ